MDKKIIVNENDFAKAVVISSPIGLSTKEKLDLYIEAYSLAREHNEGVNKEQKRSWDI